MRSLFVLFTLATILFFANIVFGQDGKSGKKGSKPGEIVSFKNKVFPVIKKNCLPCHAEESWNPSELSLDNYTLLMEGGKHGTPVLPGKSKESILIQKLSADPPFGDPMPLDPKKKKGEVSKKRLSDEEIKLIATWIDQGAKNN